MRRLGFVVREALVGLRRNLTMSLAMVLTTAISLGLLGAGLLERINRTGTTVLMATHDRHIVDAKRRRVVELSMGKLARDDARGVYGVR